VRTQRSDGVVVEVRPAAAAGIDFGEEDVPSSSGLGAACRGSDCSG
jgi:hypothetical protein